MEFGIENCRTLIMKSGKRQISDGMEQPNKKKKKLEGCNIMAEGFRFMPMGLVRLRTFRLSAWGT